LLVSGNSISKHLFRVVAPEPVELAKRDLELIEEPKSRFRNHVNIPLIAVDPTVPTHLDECDRTLLAVRNVNLDPFHDLTSGRSRQPRN
jgi:hypothetical protein